MTRRRIRSVLVANRGEIALRIIRTCRELGIRTIAVYSEADRAASHVMAADEAYCIGPPPSRESYLAAGTIIGTARRARADAIHPGYGFLAENPSFARMVRDAGIVFIGPSPESIAAMGDKTTARRLVQKAGVPTVPGTIDALRGVSGASAFAASAGFPVLLKAAAGGGGKGMRIVRTDNELAAAFAAAQSEARAAFGDDRVYVEKYLDGPRHVEIQVIADAQGHTLHLGERECTIQRRHQKIIEESPSVIVDDGMREAMGATAVKAAMSCGYENVGTVEFLVDRDRCFYFLEMNTRLQVEHPVTEMRTGLDLVALQIAVAEGTPLPLGQDDVAFNGHAIECRICAEDVENGFLPATGRILHLRTPGGAGIREDRGVGEGGEIPLYYDSMIAKLIAWAPGRAEAIARMSRALAEYELLGVKSNVGLCRFVIDHPRFKAGDFTTHFLEEEFTPERLRTSDARTGQAAAAVCALLSQEGELAGAPGRNGRPVLAGSRWKKGGRDFTET
ncbi:MAG: acetyl-CoA carboxylase biotin carboxylase subunit [Bacteroidota bacterium]